MDETIRFYIRQALQALLNKRMLICIFTGFASGMPLYLLISLVPAWLRTEGVGLKEIGFFALIGLPYTWKFLWSPLLDPISYHSFPTNLVCVAAGCLRPRFYYFWPSPLSAFLTQLHRSGLLPGYVWQSLFSAPLRI